MSSTTAPSTALTCPACKASVTGRYCSSCGALVATAKCVECASPLSPGARYCHLCGTPASAASPGTRNVSG
ncbi:MAG: double zinc ribbon domain-containing protein, partial [Gemmatimonadaceae bacterium]